VQALAKGKEIDPAFMVLVNAFAFDTFEFNVASHFSAPYVWLLKRVKHWVAWFSLPPPLMLPFS
jgi:hypothetical protein